MKLVLTIFVLLAAAAAVYWLMVLPLRKQWADYRSLHATLSDVDATLWFRVKMSMRGLRTILFNYAILITTFTLETLELIGSISIAVILPAIDYPPIHVTPEQYLMIISGVCSWINVRLRMVTNTPVGSPVSEAEAVVEVPTVVGKPDVAIVSEGPAVVAVADTVKAPQVTASMETERPSVAEVVKASGTGETIVVNAKVE